MDMNTGAVQSINEKIKSLVFKISDKYRLPLVGGIDVETRVKDSDFALYVHFKFPKMGNIAFLNDDTTLNEEAVKAFKDYLDEQDEFDEIDPVDFGNDFIEIKCSPNFDNHYTIDI